MVRDKGCDFDTSKKKLDHTDDVIHLNDKANVEKEESDIISGLPSVRILLSYL